MKFAFILGGLVGFCALLLTGVLVGKPLVDALIEASLGSVLAGLLFRWLGQIWIRNVKQMLMEKQQAALAAMAEAEERRQKQAKDLG